MSDLPILFSEPMIRLLLAGRKTQTRRILSPQYLRFFNGEGYSWRPSKQLLAEALADVLEMRKIDGVWTWTGKAYPYQGATRTIWMTHVTPSRGDRLWVREGLKAHALGLEFAAALGLGELPPEIVDMNRHDLCASYAADDEPCVEGPGFDRAWLWKRRAIPGIHMPRAFSRLTLVVTDIRLERLQSISKDDVIAEGITERDGLPIADVFAGWHEPYADLWEHLNGEGSWDANPWIVAILLHRSSLQHRRDAAVARAVDAGRA